MRNQDSWRPTKFVIRNQKIGPSPDANVVAVHSRFFTRMIGEHYAAALRQFGHGDLLDLGCGAVPLYAAYRDHVRSTTCIDWPGSRHGSEHVDYALDLNLGLPLNPESFDTILATDVLEHIASPDLLWREMARIAKPEACLIIGVPFLYWIHEQPFDYFRYTEFALRAKCHEHCLEIVELRAYGGALSVIADLIGKQLGRGLMSRLYQAHLTVLWHIKAVRSLFLKRSAAFPAGYILIARKKRSPQNA